MGTEFKGSSLVVEYNTVTLSGQMRTVAISEEAGDTEEIDITHRGDAARQILEGFPGSVTATVELGALDEGGETAPIYDFAMNAKDTLIVYPEGKTNGLFMATINNARLIARSQDTPYDGAVEWKATFNAKNSVTWGTYASA